MENASKALLIAGAILIVILLIAVGMMVYQGAQGSINKAIGSMSSTEKDIHNKQFESYMGQKVSGSNLKTLYSKIISNNSNEDNVQVNISKFSTDGTISGPNNTMITSAELSSSMSNIKTSASVTYSVTAEYSDGVITKITITKNS